MPERAGTKTETLQTPIPEGESCYMYQAAYLCEACGEAVREELDASGKAPDDPDDESTYDSDDYPKGPYVAEQAEVCDRMDACLSLPREGEVAP